MEIVLAFIFEDKFNGGLSTTSFPQNVKTFNDFIINKQFALF